MASIEGLWAVEFGHAGSEFVAINAGIAVLETNRVFGGDSWFAYTGTFQTTPSGVTGALNVKRHHHDPGSIDAFGTGDDEFTVDLVASQTHDGRLEGTIERNGHKLGVRLRKLSDLP
jgi:hypothetical protein